MPAVVRAVARRSRLTATLARLQQRYFGDDLCLFSAKPLGSCTFFRRFFSVSGIQTCSIIGFALVYFLGQRWSEDPGLHDRG